MRFCHEKPEWEGRWLRLPASSASYGFTTIGYALTAGVWLYVAKHRQRFKHLQPVLCARKTLVSYWFIVSC